MRQLHRPETPIDAYLERIALKTGKLFEAACLLGSRDPRLGRFGLALGIAFQIADDILDCSGDSTETGKVAGTDLREGTPTLAALARGTGGRGRAHGPRRRPARGRAGARRGDRGARAQPGGGARLRFECEGESERRRPPPGARGARRSSRREEALTGWLCWTARPRWTGSATRSSPANGSTSRTASRCSSRTTCSASASSPTRPGDVRGGTDEVYFVQNLYLNQTNVCRVKCKFCAFAKTRKQEDAYTITTEELVADALRAARGDRLHRDPHGERREPARGLRLLRRRDALAARGDARRPPEALHGVRDPPHDDALRPHARAGADAS